MYSVGLTVKDVQLNLAAQVKILRKQMGFTQADLSARAQVSLGSYKRFESTGLIASDALILYPNPVQDVLHINGLAGKEFEYEVLSIDGKLLQKGKSQGEISVKELRKGNYVLRVGQQQVSFVKQ